MKITVALFLLSLAITNTSLAQSEDEKKKVEEPITRLFLGMNKGDSSLVHSAFAKQVTMATIGKNKSGNPFIHYESGISDFLKAVGTPHTESWNEPIWGLKISIDDNFAQAWADYAFYRGKKFSHCGVDAFHLVKEVDGTWKIFHLSDTRKKEDCKIPEEVSNRFK